MITCQEAKQYLWEYYDEACAPARRQAMEEHLARCGDCQGSLEEWVVLSRKAFHKQSVKAPPFLWTRVLAAIEAQEEKRGAGWWAQWRWPHHLSDFDWGNPIASREVVGWMARVAAVASLLVSLGAGLVFFQSSQAVSLETLLRGETSPQMAKRFSNGQDSASWEVTAGILGGKSWEEN